MPDTVTQAKWDKAAPTFDIMAAKGAEERWLPFKKKLFSNMDGKILRQGENIVQKIKAIYRLNANELPKMLALEDLEEPDKSEKSKNSQE